MFLDYIARNTFKVLSGPSHFVAVVNKLRWSSSCVTRLTYTWTSLEIYAWRNSSGAIPLLLLLGLQFMNAFLKVVTVVMGGCLFHQDMTFNFWEWRQWRLSVVLASVWAMTSSRVSSYLVMWVGCLSGDSPRSSARYCPILTKIGICGQILLKSPPVSNFMKIVQLVSSCCNK
jgi:hypothetical protein